MEISPIQRHVQASSLPLDKLAANTQISEQDKITEVSRQFEAVLVRQFLTEAQKVSLDKKTESPGSDIYKDMVTNQMADGISRSGGFGLAGTLKTQLGRQLIRPENSDGQNNGVQDAKNSL
jgi:Rod binding domain-containing protein